MSNIIYVENVDRINEFISLTNKEYTRTSHGIEKEFLNILRRTAAL